MSSINWSSPVRAVGSRQLAPLPNEIYLDIFDCIDFDPETTQVSRKHILSTLALVCRLFCALALPRIFKTLEFSGGMSVVRESLPTHSSFCRAVIKGQKLAQTMASHVKECKFVHWHDDSEAHSWVYKGFLGMYSQALGFMSNLQQLDLICTKIDKRTLKAMCSLKSLQGLTIDGCSFNDDITDAVLRKLTPVMPLSLVLNTVRVESMRAGTIKILSHVINAERLKRLQTNDWETMQGTLRDVGLNALLQLNLNTTIDNNILIQILQASPSLTNLRVQCLLTETSPKAILPNSSMRELQVLECPLSLAYLISGRPVHTVIVTGSDLGKSLVELQSRLDTTFLKQSTRGIKTLHICSQHLLRPIHEHFPNLVELRLFCTWNDAVGVYQKLLENLASPDEPMTSLRQLVLDFGHVPYQLHYLMDLKLQRHVFLPLLEKAFPKLDTISFSGVVFWHRAWASESWSLSLSKEHKLLIRAYLSRMEEPIPGDYCGFYGTLLSNFVTA